MRRYLGVFMDFGYGLRLCYWALLVKSNGVIVLEEGLCNFEIVLRKGQNSHGSKTSSIDGKDARNLEL